MDTIATDSEEKRHGKGSAGPGDESQCRPTGRIRQNATDIDVVGKNTERRHTPKNIDDNDVPLVG